LRVRLPSPTLRGAALSAKLLHSVAFLAAVVPEAVTDLAGQKAAVSLQERAGDTVAQAVVEVPEAVPLEDIIAVFRAGVARKHIAMEAGSDPERIAVTVAPLPPPAFAESDADHDGQLSKKEFLVLAKPSTTFQALTLFHKIDADGDGAVTVLELLQAEPSVVPTAALEEAALEEAAPEQGAPEEAPPAEAVAIDMADFKDRMARAFETQDDVVRTCDKDSDHAFTIVEFQRCLRILSPPLTKKQLEYAFAGLDANGDRKVTESEYVAVTAIGIFHPSAAHLKAALDAATANLRHGSPPITLEDFKARLQLAAGRAS